VTKEILLRDKEKQLRDKEILLLDKENQLLREEILRIRQAKNLGKTFLIIPFYIHRIFRIYIFYLLL